MGGQGEGAWAHLDSFDGILEALGEGYQEAGDCCEGSVVESQSSLC